MNEKVQVDRSTHKLGAFLVKMNLVSKADMTSVLDDLAGLNADLPFILDKRGFVDELTVAKTLSNVFQLPLIREVLPSKVLTDLNAITIQDMDRYRLLPIAYEHTGAIPNIKMVMSNPFNLLYCQSFSTRMTVGISIGVSSFIKQTLSTLLSRQPEANLDSLVLAQLIHSGIVTAAHIDFAKSTIHGQRRKPLPQSGSKQTVPSKTNLDS
jgi:hypothetical protein